MRRKKSFAPAFVIAISISLLILILSISGKLNFLTSFLEKGTSAIQGASYKTFQKLPFVSEGTKVKKLEEEKLNLLSRVSDYERLKRENQALSDQFQTSYPEPIDLLKADVISAPGFVPEVSVPSVFILDKGAKDNIRKDYVVVLKDNLVGIVSQVSENQSKVDVLNNSSLSFTAKTESGATGVMRGGDTLILDNILLSENVNVGELVLTKGDVEDNGIGILPDLIVGKITSIEKKPTELFQKAKVESFVNFVNLSSVFIYMQAE